MPSAASTPLRECGHRQPPFGLDHQISSISCLQVSPLEIPTQATLDSWQLPVGMRRPQSQSPAGGRGCRRRRPCACGAALRARSAGLGSRPRCRTAKDHQRARGCGPVEVGPTSAVLWASEMQTRRIGLSYEQPATFVRLSSGGASVAKGGILTLPDLVVEPRRDFLGFLGASLLLLRSNKMPADFRCSRFHY